MKLLKSISEARRWFQTQRSRQKRVVIVPTMGALHIGHLSLLRKARRLAGKKGIVAISVFVNPAQFGPKEDFKKYPRTLKQDRDLCKKAGVDAFFYPDSRRMYSPDFSTWVEEISLSAGLCGKSRPGHFRGVCTVVLKLFNIVRPDAAVFGGKDYQQAQVIRKMVRDLDFPVQIVVAPTIRERSGLACSSRNKYLSAEERQIASRIYRALVEAKKAAGHGAPRSRSRVDRGSCDAGFRVSGVRNAAARRGAESRSRHSSPLSRAESPGARDKKIRSETLIRQIKRRLSGFRIDYIAVVDARTLQPLKTARQGNCIALAVFLDKVRLIDNIIL